MSGLCSSDLLWGMLCLVEHRKFPMRCIVDFFWERRDSLCGTASRFGETRWRVELALTRSLAFGEVAGVLIADLDPGEHMVRLAAGPLAGRRQLLETAHVYATHGDELRRLARELDAYIASRASTP